jgi:hypothetical protein
MCEKLKQISENCNKNKTQHIFSKTNLFCPVEFTVQELFHVEKNIMK